MLHDAKSGVEDARPFKGYESDGSCNRRARYAGLMLLHETPLGFLSRFHLVENGRRRRDIRAG